MANKTKSSLYDGEFDKNVKEGTICPDCIGKMVIGGYVNDKISWFCPRCLKEMEDESNINDIQST